jgi:hypothetical protein
MTPKEKAKELVEKMSMGEEFNGSVELMELYPVPKNKYAKECAIRAVSEIIKSEPRYPNGVDWEGAGDSFQYHKEAEKRKEAKKYWEEVKQEIEKL